jgi:hypothetical protein
MITVELQQEQNQKLNNIKKTGANKAQNKMPGSPAPDERLYFTKKGTGRSRTVVYILVFYEGRCS